MLITFEGIEGSGKSTQLDLLHDYLQAKGHAVVKTREPGGTAFGEALRDVLLRRGFQVMPLSELLVIMAIRAQHVDSVIMPALSEGKIVLCDRFVDATYAYQGYGRGIDLGIIETLNRLVTKGVRPNLTILLDCEVETGLARKQAANGSMDRFEKEAVVFHQAVMNAYRKLAAEDTRRFFMVGSNLPLEEARRVIREKVEVLLETHGV
jgi:dTMP kinase